MKYFLTILFFVVAVNALAQNKVITKYYDSLWQPVSKEKANFYTEFKPQDTFYKVTSYYYPSMKLYGKSTWLDTLFKKGYGVGVSYYPTGKLKDSVGYYNDTLKNFLYHFSYYENGNIENSFTETKMAPAIMKHYYNNGKIFAVAEYDKKNELFINVKGYDENGNLIPNFIFRKMAEFSGGKQKWRNYIKKKLKSKIPFRNGAPAGEYEVIVRFDINENGKVENVNAENNPGYGTKEEAIRVIKNSPDWNPAIQFNKLVLTHYRQKIVFRVD